MPDLSRIWCVEVPVMRCNAWLVRVLIVNPPLPKQGILYPADVSDVQHLVGVRCRDAVIRLYPLPDSGELHPLRLSAES